MLALFFWQILLYPYCQWGAKTILDVELTVIVAPEHRHSSASPSPTTPTTTSVSPTSITLFIEVLVTLEIVA